MLNHIEFKLQVPKKNKSVSDINIGDEVYDCYGRRIPVEGVIVNKIKEPIYEVTYTDGRKASYLESEPIYIGHYKTTTCPQLLSDHRKLIQETGNHEMKLGSIDNVEVRYDDGIQTSIRPDPYIAGAFLIYGDYPYDFVSMPLDKSYVLQFLEMRYHLNIIDSTITWEELFSHQRPMALTKKSDDRVIPIEYVRTSIEDRWKFIRGVFDTGFDSEWSPDHLILLHRNKERLTALQELLWSVGVYSTIESTLDMDVPRSNEYRLEVHCPPEHFPRFFYNVGHMEHHLMKEKQLRRRDPEFQQSIISIDRKGEGFGKMLILDQPGRLYLMDNFLYRISG